MKRRNLISTGFVLSVLSPLTSSQEQNSTAHRPLRRTSRQLNDKQTDEVIDSCTYAILSTTDKAGYPYGVPISPVREGNHFYFHASGAKGGRKEDNMLMNPNMSL